MKQIYEVKAYHERTSYEKVWLKVLAESKEEAFRLIEDNEGDWMDSKEIDSGGGEWKDMDAWEIVNIKNIKETK